MRGAHTFEVCEEAVGLCSRDPYERGDHSLRSGYSEIRIRGPSLKLRTRKNPRERGGPPLRSGHFKTRASAGFKMALQVVVEIGTVPGGCPQPRPTGRGSYRTPWRDNLTQNHTTCVCATTYRRGRTAQRGSLQSQNHYTPSPPKARERGFS